jgi:hypothetical protein
MPAPLSLHPLREPRRQAPQCLPASVPQRIGQDRRQHFQVPSLCSQSPSSVVALSAGSRRSRPAVLLAVVADVETAGRAMAPSVKGTAAEQVVHEDWNSIWSAHVIR